MNQFYYLKIELFPLANLAIKIKYCYLSVTFFKKLASASKINFLSAKCTFFTVNYDEAYL